MSSHAEDEARVLDDTVTASHENVKEALPGFGMALPLDADFCRLALFPELGDSPR